MSTTSPTATNTANPAIGREISPEIRSETAMAALMDASGTPFMADGGLETTLVFQQGIDLPDFAAFPLLGDPSGRQALAAYYEPYLDIAQSRGIGIVLDTPTWRANPDWAARLGYDNAALRTMNKFAVAFVAELADARPGIVRVLNGAIGPRGDGYVVGDTMSVKRAADYHSRQITALAEGGADMVTAVTMTYVEEAVGITQAAAEVDVPVVVGFTVETDGRLPSGTTLAEAITEVDAVTDGAPAWYMVNCAHPSHFFGALQAGANGATNGTGSGWLGRVKAIRANASTMSHAELDEAPELDRGDPLALADDYVALQALLPDLRVFGGCCGTDHDHIGRLCDALI